MRCCKNRIGGNAKTVKLVLKRKELLYDIGNYAFVEGDVMPAKEEHERHQVMDVAQAGNVDLVTRTLNLAHSEVVEILYPYTKQEVEDGEVFDDELEEFEVYEIEMKIPENFSRTSLNHLRNLVHDYMVARVLYEWMKVTNLENRHSAENWEEKIEQLKVKMKTTILWRRKPLRRTLRPF